MKTFNNKLLEVWLQFKLEVKRHNEDIYRTKGDNIEPTPTQFFHWLEMGYLNRDYN